MSTHTEIIHRHFLILLNKFPAPPKRAPVVPPTDATTAVVPAESPAAPNQGQQRSHETYSMSHDE